VWEPRYLCFPKARDLPRITIAAGRAEGFIVFPAPKFLRHGGASKLQAPGVLDARDLSRVAEASAVSTASVAGVAEVAGVAGGEGVEGVKEVKVTEVTEVTEV
jgi:hypothetical protein